MKDWERSVPGGWHSIVEKMLNDIDAIAGVGRYSIFQIKEKFGRLECYLNWQEGVDVEIKKQASKIIEAARRQSLTRCQFCQRFGQARKVAENWTATICDDHQAEIVAKSKRRKIG